MDKRTFLFMICVGFAFFGVNAYFAPEQKPKPQIAAPAIIAQETLTPQQIQDETYYVLENEYQQLVFSSRGGSLAEINLPLHSKERPNSIVKEIDFDRVILAASKQNARFPLYPFQTSEGQSQEEGKLGGYYPLLRRPILKADGSVKSPVSPAYYALNIVGENPAFANAQYQMTRLEPNLIQFRASIDGRSITKTFSIPQEKNGPYCFNLDIQIDGDGPEIWLGSGVPDVEIVGSAYSPLLRYQLTRPNGTDVETIDLPKKGPILDKNISPNWISNNNGFLGMILDPLTTIAEGFKAEQIPGDVIPTRLTLIDPEYNAYPAANYPGYETFLPLKAGKSSFRIFAGPFDHSLLKKLDALYADPQQNYNPEYILAQKIQGWFSFISQPFAKFLFFLMDLFHWITRSWAASIVLLTFALRAMMYPLNNWQIRSSVKMQKLGPKIKELKERYKKDPKKAQMEIMNLYRASGINPISGCFPMLLQMPFLLGMFYLLKSSFPLRGAVFIPGWIDDLAAPDVLFSWGQPIWFIGHELHLLPILMGLTMYLQQYFTAKLPKDQSKLTEEQKQQKMMGTVMSIVFIVMFYNFPSGLNIYFMLSTLLGIAQQMWMTKKMKMAP